MESLHYDAIDSNSFRFSNPPHNNAPISDHDLCFADVRLLYDNIYCVKEKLTHVTSDIESPHVERGEGFTAHYTVDSGYEIHNVVIWVIDENYKIQDTVWDETTLTVNIPANLVTNDIFIRIDAIKTVLERTPPELAGDIYEKGIVLTGGGALLRGFDKLVSFATNMPVVISERPLDSVVDGTLICLENNFRNLYQNKTRSNF